MKDALKSVLAGAGLLTPAKKLSRAMRERKFRAEMAALAGKHGCSVEFGSSYVSVRKENREIRIDPKHAVYVGDMINFFGYYHGAVFPKDMGGFMVVDYSRPALHRLSPSGVEFEFPALPESDETTEAYMEALNIKPGNVVLDFGAYAGASTYFMAKAVGPDGIVVAFEPDELNFKFLSANVARHSLSNVIPVRKGVWSETTVLMFQSEGNMGSSLVDVLGRDDNVTKVEVLSLEDASALARGREVDTIKMDIEGAELFILKNAGEFLRRHRTPRLVIEPHKIDGVLCTEEVSQLLKGYGYVVTLLSQGTEDWPLVVAHLP